MTRRRPSLNPPRTVMTSWKGVYDRLGKGITERLLARGFKVPAAIRADAWRCLVAALRVEDRSVPIKVRNVRHSELLTARKLEPWIAAAVATIEQESRAGADLNPRLTRDYFRAGFNDALNADLRVQHLHLGAHGHGKNGQVGATSELLYAVVSPDELYFIDVLNHDAFDDGKFSEIIKANWRHLLGPPMVGIRSAPRNDDDVLEHPDVVRARMRRAGVTTAIDVDGVPHLPPGLGLATDGTPVGVVDAADRLMVYIRDAYTWLEKDADELAAALASAAGRRVSELNLWPVLDGETLTFREQETRALIFPGDGRVLVPIPNAVQLHRE